MIVDAHTHIGGEKVGFNMTEAMVLEMMDKYRVNFCIVSNADSAELDHSQRPLPENVQISEENSLKRVISFARSNPDRIGVAVWVKPYSQQPSNEFLELMEDNMDIIHAIKLHPYHSNVSPVDKRVIPYLELADKYKIAVVSHTGGCEAASPKYMLEAAKLFPDIPFVMAHMGLGTDNSEAIKLLGRADNLYGDTAWVGMESTIKAINLYGKEKVIFGSDAPIDGVDTYLCNPKGEKSIYQDYFNIIEERIGSDAYEYLMYKNAICVYGLNRQVK